MINDLTKVSYLMIAKSWQNYIENQKHSLNIPILVEHIILKLKILVGTDLSNK